MPRIDDHDVGAAVAGHELLAADLVDDHDVGLGEVLRGADGHQARITWTRADEGDAARLAGGLGGGGQFFDGRVRSAHKARSVADRSGRGSTGWTFSVAMMSAAPSASRTAASSRPTRSGSARGPTLERRSWMLASGLP